MKFRFAFIAASLLNLLAMTGCNGVGDKDSILARIDKEVVYREDLVLLMKNSIGVEQPLDRLLYDEVYAKEAVVSRAVAQFPEIKGEWEEYFKGFESRLLTQVYQRFYINERLTYSEAELRQFYEENRGLFEEAPLPDFGVIQGVVASELYMSKFKESLNIFLLENMQGSSLRSDSVKWMSKFVEMHRAALRGQIAKDIAKERHVTFHDLPKMDPQKFYESHKDLFMTAPGYELFHIQGKDSSALSALIGESVNLDQFKKVAASKSSNKVTAKKGGFVGYVKKHFALPYDIGMMPNLDLALEGKEAGFVTPVLRSGDGLSYHVFYLSAVIPPRQKEFERVAGEIQSGIASGVYFDVDTSFVVMSKNGKPLLTEGELQRYCAREYHATLNAKNHQRLMSLVTERILFSEAALALKLDKSWEYRAMLRAAYRDFVCTQFFYKLRENIVVSDDSLKKFFDLYGNPVHVEYALEDAKNEVRAGAMFPMNIFRHEYFVNRDKYYVGMSFERSVPHIFKMNWRMESDMTESRIAAEFYSSSILHFYDSSIPEGNAEILADKLLAKAESLGTRGQLDESVAAYRKVMFAYGENDSLFKKAVYETAQIFNEADRFNDAEVEYLACYEMFPDSPEAEKAMFSRGFILSENLNRNDEALTVLKQFQQKYPQSELKESVDWLVQNIESNGKLADDLIKKISAEE